MDGNLKCSDDSKFIIKELRQIELTVQSLLKITEREELAIGGGKLFVKILSELNADVIITNSYFLKFGLQALLLVIIVFYWKIVDDSGVGVVAAVYYLWFWIVNSRVCDVLVGTVGLVAVQVNRQPFWVLGSCKSELVFDCDNLMKSSFSYFMLPFDYKDRKVPSRYKAISRQ